MKVTAIFDIGKTNKKLLLFNQQFELVYEESTQLVETTDEDGDACEDLNKLLGYIQDSFAALLANPAYSVEAVNITSYGASLVYVDEFGQVLTPLYNYLKPFPVAFSSELYRQYGGESAFSLATASPALGSLNSGLQLYRFSKQQPELFHKTRFALHLPQFLASRIHGQYYSEITSIGCHTALWDFKQMDYHPWVAAAGLQSRLAPIAPAGSRISCELNGRRFYSGIGIHDSSAALVPYLRKMKADFLLLSTGTWCVTLNPFSTQPLTAAELRQDCLCYLSHGGTPVKAARFFAGDLHEREVRRLALHFNKPAQYYNTVLYDPGLYALLRARKQKDKTIAHQSLAGYSSYEEAYHALIYELVQAQYRSSMLVQEGCNSRRMLVEGGFCRNKVYMQMLANTFTGWQLFAALMPQTAALGAAMVLNEAAVVEIELTRYLPQ